MIGNTSVSEYRVPNTADNASFSEIKRRGDIKMTPLIVSKITDTPSLVYRPKVSFAFSWSHLDDGTIWDSRGPMISMAQWKEAYSFDTVASYASAQGLPLYRLSEIDQSEVERTVESCKSTIVSRSYQTLDALTALAECKDTLSLISSAISAVRHPLRTFRHELSQLRKGKGKWSPKREAQLWLQYRYAVMPEIYQVQDAIKLLKERKFLFSTERTGKIIAPKQLNPDVPEFSDDLKYINEEVTTGSVSVRAVGKARFGTSSQKVFGLTSFNPAITAWELIPYSFVVDWFINVGDWIAAQSMAIADVAQQRKFCYSIRTNVTTEWRVRSKYRWSSSYTWDSSHATGTIYSPYYEYTRVYRRRTEDSYIREVFQPAEVSLMFNPSLSTERWTDSFALSLSSITGTLKKLR